MQIPGLDIPGHLNTDHRLIAGFLCSYQNDLALIHENAHDKLTGLLNRKTSDDRFISIFLKSRNSDPVLNRLRAREPLSLTALSSTA
jgi:GGDEF domain-containing protein